LNTIIIITGFNLNDFNSSYEGIIVDHEKIIKKKKIEKNKFIYFSNLEIDPRLCYLFIDMTISSLRSDGIHLCPYVSMMGQFHVLRLYYTDLAHQDFKSLGAARRLHKYLTDFTMPGHQVTAEKKFMG
jgi:hypothetical protein